MGHRVSAKLNALVLDYLVAQQITQSVILVIEAVRCVSLVALDVHAVALGVIFALLLVGCLGLGHLDVGHNN